MRIALITSEVVPFSKTGGLADVCGALARALSGLGADVTVVSPLYREVRRNGIRTKPVKAEFTLTLGERRIHGGAERTTIPGTKIPVLFIRQDEFYDRDGLYGTPEGDHKDNAARFIFFCRAALEVLRATGEPPDIVHVHDWQTGLIPIYLKTLFQKDFPDTASVLTIHNLAYQGLFWHWDMKLTGLDWQHFNWLEMEFFGKINLLKTGIVHADAITTVSPTYAREIQTKELGCGLDGALEVRLEDLHGILNGADYGEWDPAQDSLLPAKYSVKSLAGKAKCKAELQKECGLPVREDIPLFASIGRLAAQKGIDLLVPAIRRLEEDAQFVLLGTGDTRYQDEVAELGRQFPARVSANVGFDNALAHRIEAGADLFLMPSRYEPCGLNQIYSMRYGTVPVVRATGGLADTVEDGETGFVFEEYSTDALLKAARRALAAYGDRRKWGSLVRAIMKKDFSWKASAKKYMELFQSLKT